MKNAHTGTPERCLRGARESGAGSWHSIRLEIGVRDCLFQITISGWMEYYWGKRGKESLSDGCAEKLRRRGKMWERSHGETMMNEERDRQAVSAKRRNEK